ncbi:hypothetical protein [Lacinutrix undariae]
MNTIKAVIILSIFFIIFSCKENDKTKSKDSISTKIQTQEKLAEDIDKLVLTESALGHLKLTKRMSVEELKIKASFTNLTVTKNVGAQDGPNYFYYKIGTEAILTTPDTENSILSQLLIKENSNVSDIYGVKLGMTYIDVNKKRSNMSISTEHYHIYLRKEGSNIAYEMSLGNYDGPDKEEYSIDDIKNSNSKVISIIWE